MTDMLGTIAVAFALVALGYGLVAGRLLKPGTGDGLNDFVVAVAIPVLLFRTLSTADLDGADPVLLWVVYFSAIAISWTTATLLIRRAFVRDARAGVVAGVSGSFSNLVLLGIPLILSLFGQAGFEVLSLLVAIHLPIMMGLSVILFEVAQRKDGVGYGATNPMAVLVRFLRSLVSNPLVVGILLGLLWRATGLGTPRVAAEVIDRIAGIAGPLALIALGMSLRKFGVSRNLPQGAAMASVKLALMPALVTGGAWLVGLQPDVARVAIVAAAMPTGVNPYLIATRFGTGEALASNTMVVATAFSPLTILFWLWVGQTLF